MSIQLKKKSLTNAVFDLVVVVCELEDDVAFVVLLVEIDGGLTMLVDEVLREGEDVDDRVELELEAIGQTAA